MSLSFSHIPYERLVDLAEGRVPGNQQATLTTHLAACARCRDEATRVERMVAAMRSDTSVDAPPTVIARAVSLFRSRAISPAPSLLQRLVAVLSFESTPLTPALGMRSEGSTERQMIYTADAYDVDLRLTPVTSGWMVAGQILGGGDETGQATLTGEGTTLHAPIFDQASFSFPVAPAGHYALTLTLSADEVIVEDLRVGDA